MRGRREKHSHGRIEKMPTSRVRSKEFEEKKGHRRLHPDGKEGR